MQRERISLAQDMSVDLAEVDSQNFGQSDVPSSLCRCAYRPVNSTAADTDLWTSRALSGHAGQKFSTKLLQEIYRSGGFHSL